jgi:hypothetical protein
MAATSRHILTRLFPHAIPFWFLLIYAHRYPGLSC